MAQNEYFVADGLNKEDLEKKLANGWRKFGYFYFRPRCPLCQKCQPIRVLAQKFQPSKSQKRVIKKNSDTKVIFQDLEFRPEIFEIYKDHSWNRFQEKPSLKEFLMAHYYPSCPTMQSEYYIDDTLAAVGFLDISSKGLSSCYFIYRDTYKDYRLGFYSVIAEIQQAAKMGLSYYYLGYYIQENHSMSYKNRFFPHEIMDWKNKQWFEYHKG
jgi:arginine-tRNA-protein transferase